MESISQFIAVLNKAELYPNSEELADVFWLALQIDVPATQNKHDLNNEDPISNQDDSNNPSLENIEPPKNKQDNLPETQSTSQKQSQKSQLFPHQQNGSGINTGGIKGQAFRNTCIIPIT